MTETPTPAGNNPANTMGGNHNNTTTNNGTGKGTKKKRWNNRKKNKRERMGNRQRDAHLKDSQKWMNLKEW